MGTEKLYAYKFNEAKCICLEGKHQQVCKP